MAVGDFVRQNRIQTVHAMLDVDLGVAVDRCADFGVLLEMSERGLHSLCDAFPFQL